ncbi:MAG TPA: type I secretion system permease/ATPase [Hyphomicrobiaceae bacterium]|nr:type I secretion system permease/ATPase [Hyphomicrobiaceae bacterium]
MKARRRNDPAPGSELRVALEACRSAFISLGLFSGTTSILALTGSLYMLEVYDRVLPSRSIPTLIALSLIVVVLFSAYGVLDLIRNRILVRIGASLNEAMGERIYRSLVQLPLKTGAAGDGLQPLRDLDTLRTFLSGQGLIAFYDLPWLPLYLAVIFAFHVYLGLAALCGTLLLVCLTLLSELFTKAPIAAATKQSMTRHGLAETSRRNAEALVAMGMAPQMGALWSDANRKYLLAQQDVSDIAGNLGGVSKILRLILQSAVLGIGAYLVIHQEATAGVIIAGSILTSRALAPVDLAIANWKNFVAARQGWQRLAKLLVLMPERSRRLALPSPRSQVSVEGASVMPPGGQRLVLGDVTFSLKAGQGLGIIGPSASGKSSLVRILVGVWEPARGKVCLDGAALDQWSSEALGRHIGYLPQDVELFPGSVAQNISRFELVADPQSIVAAAQAAGVHDMIVGLPDGYDTQVGDHGMGLSAGQQQRVALARALYGDPFLVVLDEPNSNLDSDGEQALTQAIMGVRARGGIVVVVAHRANAIAGTDTILALAGGRVKFHGPKDEVLAKAGLQPVNQPTPLRIGIEGTRGRP